jgi:ketosteroid isomerase-like protein
MGRAREIMDGVTGAVLAGDRSAVRELYADDAVAESPDVGRLVGRDAIADYLVGFSRAFPDLAFAIAAELEAGDTAVDEGYMIGTNTGALTTPDGELPATGRSIRVRSCDVLTVRGGLAVEHRFYYDQLEFLTQLGLGDQQGIVLPEQEARAQTRVVSNG